MRHAVNFLVGLIFGLGLLISGMANPAKVQNFLDLAGSFDPSLIFVMASALAVTPRTAGRSGLSWRIGRTGPAGRPGGRRAYPASTAGTAGAAARAGPARAPHPKYAAPAAGPG